MVRNGGEISLSLVRLIPCNKRCKHVRGFQPQKFMGKVTPQHSITVPNWEWRIIPRILTGQLQKWRAEIRRSGNFDQPRARFWCPVGVACCLMTIDLHRMWDHLMLIQLWSWCKATYLKIFAPLGFKQKPKENTNHMVGEYPGCCWNGQAFIDFLGGSKQK